MSTSTQQTNPHSKPVSNTSTIQCQSNILTTPLLISTPFKKLSSNQINFVEILQTPKDLPYFNKTKLIINVIISLRGRIIISEPRCFGQSLFLNTVKCLFQGDKNLLTYMGLSNSKESQHPKHINPSKDSDSITPNEKSPINNTLNHTNKKNNKKNNDEVPQVFSKRTLPVITLDYAKIDTGVDMYLNAERNHDKEGMSNALDIFEIGLIKQLEDFRRINNFVVKNSHKERAASFLKELIEMAAKKNKENGGGESIVLLIDGYNSPFQLSEKCKPIFEFIKSTLAHFYQQFKDRPFMFLSLKMGALGEDGDTEPYFNCCYTYVSDCSSYEDYLRCPLGTKKDEIEQCFKRELEKLTGENGKVLDEFKERFGKYQVNVAGSSVYSPKSIKNVLMNNII